MNIILLFKQSLKIFMVLATSFLLLTLSTAYSFAESETKEASLENSKNGQSVEKDASKAERNPTQASKKEQAVSSPKIKYNDTMKVVSTKLKKMDLAGPSPEVRFSFEDILSSGHNTIADFIRDNPVTGLGSSRETSGYASNAGVAGINLRGLGEENTLVLLDGVRFPPISGFDTVDINRIPLSMVKEIIIIKDDLSSIYGSDAIAGVVNIITNKDYSGARITAGMTMTELKGGEKMDLNFLLGSSSAKSNITFSAGYRKNKKIYARDREWSKIGTSTLGSPGSYKDVGTNTWHPDPNCPPELIIDAGPQGKFCSFVYADYSTTLPEMEQLSLATRLNHKFSEFTNLHANFFYNRSITEYVFAPAPGFFNVPAAVADGYGLPNHTNGNDMQIRYRVVELGNRNTVQENNFVGVNMGLSHDFLDTWSLNLGMSYGRDRNDAYTTGNAINSELVNLVETGAFNPFAAAGNRGDLSSAAFQPTAFNRSNFYTADLKFSGELFELFKAPFVIDTGISYIYRDYDNRVDALTLNGLAFTGAGANGSGDRSIWAGYAQINGRLSQSLDVYLSGRYDKFSDFGDTFNPKLGLKFRPLNSLLFRATVGTGFKAPSLSRLYASRSETFETFVDRVACARDGEGSFSCKPQQYRVISEGNTDLNEISSFSYSLGLLYEPSSSLDIGLDFWVVEQDGLIVTGTNEVVLERATEAETKGIDPSKYGYIMNRDPNGNLDPNNPIRTSTVNLQSSQIAGIDLSFNKAFGLSKGKLMWQNTLSLRLFEKIEPFPGLGVEDYIKTRRNPGYRNLMSLGYILRSHKAKLSMVSTDKFLNADESALVDRFNRFDLSYSYTGIEDLEFSMGLINLLGQTPPLDETDPNNQIETSLYSERGREFFFRLTKHF